MKTSKIFRLITGFLIAAIAIVFAVVPESHAMLLNHPGLSLGASPLVTIFTRQIKENLYPANEYYKNSVDHSAFVNGNKVNVPRAGADPTVVIDPASWPLDVEPSEEDAGEYEIHTHATKPTHIQDDEELEVSYDKRAHVLRKHIKTLNTSIADTMAHDWAPTAAEAATNYVRTTGGNTSTALSPGATGTRAMIAIADIVNVVNLMDKADVPTEGRYAVIPSSMYNDLFKIDGFIDYQKRGLTDLLGKGMVGEIMGVKIYKRSRVVVYTNAATPVKKAVGAATAATDNMAAIFWQEGMVARAEGGTKVYINPDKAEYLGGLFNARVRAGGQCEYENKRGVIALIQAAGV